MWLFRTFNFFMILFVSAANAYLFYKMTEIIWTTYN